MSIPRSAATVPLVRFMFQTERWNEAIRMAELKAQSPSTGITNAVSVRADDIKATAFSGQMDESLRPDL
ncbi:MAG: hypothetical protein QOH31_6165 [Verrucomicrobiota bacterium]|jgi:hypothetical protein